MDLGIDGISDDAEAIGSGGSSTVYRATQVRLGRQVAVKILNVHLGQGSDAERRRFEREQLALGTLSDLQGIVPLYESGFTADDRPYLIMPLYVTGSLQKRLDDDGAVPWQTAAEYMIPVGRAVDRAHAAGVLHRDIKPANIMFDRGGSPVIGDFGIALLAGSTTLFQSRALSATPAYSPPEVFAGIDPTPAVDVYGLGATLFALINGSPAFVSVTGDLNVLALMRRVDSDPVPDLRELAVPDALAALVERSMAKSPDDRHANAAEWTDELQSIVAQHPLDRPPVVPPVVGLPAPVVGAGDAAIPAASDVPESAAARNTEQPPEPAGRPRSRRRLALAAAGLVAVAAGVVGAIVVADRGGGDDTAADDGGLETVAPETATTPETVASTTPATSTSATSTTATTTTGLTTTTTPATTTTELTTSTPLPTVPPEEVARATLASIARDDEVALDELAGHWVPQLSAKQLGTVWNGLTWQYQAILQEHLDLRAQFDAILADGGGAYVFRTDGQPMVGWFITLVRIPYSEPDGALAWCADSGFGSDDCFAKLLTTDQSVRSTTKHAS